MVNLDSDFDKRVFIVIPTYDEAKTLTSLVEEIFSHHPGFNVIIVDDNSPDGTGEIADRMAADDPRIHVIHRRRKLGLGTAYVKGFQEALARGADLIFEMDADFSHDVKYLKEFLKASQKADLIIGSRYINGVRVEGWKFSRLLLSKLANVFVSFVMVKPIWDFTAGFRCYHRKVLESVDLTKIVSDGYAFQIEMIHLAYNHGFKVREIPILFKEREGGYSKIGRRIIWEAFWLTLKCHSPLLEIIKHLPYLHRDYKEFTNKNSVEK